MKRLIVYCLAAGALLAPRVLNAAVMSRDWKTPGDGLLTYDNVNRREWLDLSQTILSSQFPGADRDAKYQYVVEQTGAGGLFEGFEVGKSSDVVALAQSAGIITNGLQSPENVPAVLALGDLVSYTAQGANGNRHFIGLLDETGDPPASNRVGAIFAFNAQATPDRAGLRIGSNDDLLFPPASPVAVFLFRPIPEPNAAWMFLIGSSLLKKRRKKARKERLPKPLRFESLEDRRVLEEERNKRGQN